MNSRTSSLMTTILALPLNRNRTNVMLHAFMVLAGSLLLWASAKFQVPFYPVPMTMQTSVVVLLGLIMGPYTAVASVLAYLSYGAFGLPVFSGTPEKGIGLAYMVGPTGGYLVGFVLSAFIAGYLAIKPFAKNLLGLTIIALISAAVVYAPGVLWLGTMIGYDQAVQFGLIPFILGDAVKAVLAAVIAASLLHMKRFRGH